MLTSIATIATTITALVGIGWKIYDSYKKNKIAKHIEDGRSLEKRILEAKTNEERAELVRLLNNHNAK